MRIDGLGTPNLPIAPAAAAAAAPSQAFNANASAAALALQQEEQKGGGGGGHGGGHGAKKVIDAIDDIAARNSLNIEQRKKTMLDRQREIEKLKLALAAEGETIGEKDGEPRDEQHDARDDADSEDGNRTA